MNCDRVESELPMIGLGFGVGNDWIRAAPILGL